MCGLRPQIIQKWGTYDRYPLTQLPNWVTVFETSEDFGPATKLLGALEYAVGKDFDAVITVDDDVIFNSPKHLEYIYECFKAALGYAITIHGVRLKRAPFHIKKRGLSHSSKFMLVDVPSGGRGVAYPLKPLMASEIPFRLRENLPNGVFNDDDAYFGAVLHKLGVPLVAIPKYPGDDKSLAAATGHGGSAVEELAEIHRIDNESELFNYFVGNGLIACDRNRAEIENVIREKIVRIFRSERRKYWRNKFTAA